MKKTMMSPRPFLTQAEATPSAAPPSGASGRRALLSQSYLQEVLPHLFGTGDLTAMFVLLVFLLEAFAAVTWLTRGHPSATNFAAVSDWLISWSDPQTANISLLGTVCLALLGATMPLSFGAELKQRRAVSKHLLYGSLLV